MTTRSLDWLDVAYKYLCFGLILVTGFFFWNLTSEFYETPKFIALVGLSGAMLILWAVRCILEGKLSFTKTPIDIPLVILLIVFGVSTFFAVSKPLAIIGSLPRVHGGLASYILYILIYFALVSNIKKVSFVKQSIFLLVGSGVVLSVVSLLQYFGVYLFGLNFSQFTNFTPTGSSFSTAAVLTLLLPFPLISILRASKDEMNQASSEIAPSSTQNVIKAIGIKTLLTIILSLFTATIILLGNPPSQDNSWISPIYLTAALTFVLAFLYSPQKQIQQNSAFMVTPILVAIIVAVLSFTSVIKTPFYNQAQNFPREIQLPFITSWKVSVSAFRDAPLWGSGPSSYLNDFTQYKPIEFNDSKFWNIRFDLAFNEYLQFLATLGGPGLIALLLLTVVFLSLSFKALATDQSVLGLALAIATINFFAILALHPSTLVLWVIGVILLAFFMIVHKAVTEQVHIGIAAAHSGDNQVKLSFDALPEVILVLALILIGTAFFFTGKFTLADYHHRQALNSVATGDGLQVYNHLLQAEQLNPYSDLYRADMAQTNFALANAIAINKGPTEASPGGSLTDQDRQNIQTLLSQAIAEGQAAVALNPNNPINWEILASIYRQIAGVAQNALIFSLDSYGRAIQKDPANPALRLNVGGVYYAIQNYDLAIRFFSDSVNLKADYANGYYNLAVALRDKGDLASAIAAAERTISILEPSSPDYQTASNLLAELKKKDAETNKSSGVKTPDQNTSALQDQNLPKVLDLPKPDNIATPEAVKKPSPTPNP